MAYICPVMSISTNRKSMTNAILEADLHTSIEYDRRNTAGEPMGPEFFPREIWNAKGSSTYKQLPQLFYAGGFWFVSAKAAAVLRQFDLGAGALYPVQVLAKDRQTPIGEEGWCCINFGNRKSAFLREHSHDVAPPPPPNIWIARGATKDDQYAVSAAASEEGPDIWVDPQVMAFFVSDDLAKALTKAKLATAFYLRRCRSL